MLETKSKTIDILKSYKQLFPKLSKLFMEKINEMVNYDLNWARPLKSIISIFNNKVVNFNFFISKWKFNF